jgi:hypothetical protein
MDKKVITSIGPKKKPLFPYSFIPGFPGGENFAGERGFSLLRHPYLSF